MLRHQGRRKGQTITRRRPALTFADVYAEHVWRVYGFLAYRLDDRSLAEDLTQSTFERALRAWPRYDPRRASVRTWLLAIAARLLLDHQRHDGLRARHELRVEAPEPVAGPEHRLDGSPELLAALAQLSEREREVIALRYGADLSTAEVGALLGLSTANVQQIASRALRRLRTLLEPGGGLEPAAPARRPFSRR